MKCDHIKAWRIYLVGQMCERYGVTKRDATRNVDWWLRSLKRERATPQTHQISKPTVETAFGSRPRASCERAGAGS